MEFKIRFFEGKSFQFQGYGKSHTAGSVGYIVSSRFGKPNCFWPKIAFLENIYMNLSVAIIPNELVCLRILEWI